MRRYIRAVKRSIRRSQTGQAILLLAFGFIILLGFVGIVTDLSILYIRFASLRRAVDSAAVAAAGQFSRTVSDAEN
ncbi:MAG: pilus assembly protein TadG-related protein, partial [Chloroflexota bacterium]